MCVTSVPYHTCSIILYHSLVELRSSSFERRMSPRIPVCVRPLRPASRPILRSTQRSSHPRGQDGGQQGKAIAVTKSSEVAVRCMQWPTSFSMEELRALCGLMANTFFVPRQGTLPLLIPFQAFLYGALITSKALNNMLICGGNAVLMVANEVDISLDSSSSQSQEPPRSSLSNPSTIGIVGAGSCHMVGLSGKMAEAMGSLPGASYALIANMAVDRDRRRRGIGRTLLKRLIERARDFRPRPAAVLLLAYKSNATAISLYQSEGFQECLGWVDPEWLAEAEKGQVGEERRLLFFKYILPL